LKPGLLARGILRRSGNWRRNSIGNGRHRAPCQDAAQSTGAVKDFTGSISQGQEQKAKS
jgi:hypothetical protein